MTRTREQFVALERHRQIVLLQEIKGTVNDMIDHLNGPKHEPSHRNAGIIESLVVRARKASKAFRSIP